MPSQSLRLTDRSRETTPTGNTDPAAVPGYFRYVRNIPDMLLLHAPAARSPLGYLQRIHTRRIDKHVYMDAHGAARTAAVLRYFRYVRNIPDMLLLHASAAHSPLGYLQRIYTRVRMPDPISMHECPCCRPTRVHSSRMLQCPPSDPLSLSISFIYVHVLVSSFMSEIWLVVIIFLGCRCPLRAKTPRLI